MRTAGEALTLVSEQDIPAVFVDEGGLGAGVVDRLRELGAPVYGVQFGGKAPQSGRFVNMRAEIFWELRRLFNEGLVAIPRDEELISQLLGLRYDVTSAGQVKMESKSSLRRRGLRSPDKADALALAFMEPPSLQIWTGYEQPVVPASSAPSFLRRSVMTRASVCGDGASPSFLRPLRRSCAPLRRSCGGRNLAPCRTSGEGAMEWGVVYRRSCAPSVVPAEAGTSHPVGGAVGGEGTQPPSFQRRLESRRASARWGGWGRGYSATRHSSGGWNPGAQRAMGRLGVRVLGHPSFQRRLESRRAARGGAVGGEGTQPPVIPAEAGIQARQRAVGRLGVRALRVRGAGCVAGLLNATSVACRPQWIPASAGMTRHRGWLPARTGSPSFPQSVPIPH